MLVHELYNVDAQRDEEIFNMAKELAYSRGTYGEMHKKAIEICSTMKQSEQLVFMLCFGEGIGLKAAGIPSYNYTYK